MQTEAMVEQALVNLEERIAHAKNPRELLVGAYHELNGDETLELLRAASMRADSFLADRKIVEHVSSLLEEGALERCARELRAVYLDAAIEPEARDAYRAQNTTRIFDRQYGIRSRTLFIPTERGHLFEAYVTKPNTIPVITYRVSAEPIHPNDSRTVHEHELGWLTVSCGRKTTNRPFDTPLLRKQFATIRRATESVVYE